MSSFPGMHTHSVGFKDTRTEPFESAALITWYLVSGILRPFSCASGRLSPIARWTIYGSDAYLASVLPGLPRLVFMA